MRVGFKEADEVLASDDVDTFVDEDGWAGFHSILGTESFSQAKQRLLFYYLLHAIEYKDMLLEGCR